MTTNNMPGMDEYRPSLDEIHFSDDAKARMSARLAETARKEGTRGTIITHDAISRRRRRLPFPVPGSFRRNFRGFFRSPGFLFRGFLSPRNSSSISSGCTIPTPATASRDS